jgi:hypothetical protein
MEDIDVDFLTSANRTPATDRAFAESLTKRHAMMEDDSPTLVKTMPERPKIYHGHYCVYATGVDAVQPGMLPRITMKHPLDYNLQVNPSNVLLNWLSISGLKADFDRWGYTWSEGIEP